MNTGKSPGEWHFRDTMMKCTTCYDLERANLFGSSTSTQQARHDFWILLKTLAELIRAAQAGCDVCDVLSSGLQAAINTEEVSLDAHKVRVEIRIPQPRHSRIRVLARRWSPMAGDVDLADLEFYNTYCSTQASWSEHQCGKFIHSGADIGVYLDAIRSWVDACTKNHAQCSDLSHTPQLPTRILDLGVSEGIVHLIESKNIPQDRRYIALSHCWGGDTVPRTLPDTHFPQEHPLASLPTSFRDAVLLARALMIRYLWIDSLCIIQDSRADWESESSKMLQYYSSAFFVIAASRSPSPSHGFLHSRQPCFVIQPQPRHRDQPYAIIARQFSPHLASDQDRTLSSPLDRRAWALQERLSARRVVHFYDAEMVWECESSTECECGKLSLASRRLENNSLPLKMRVSRAVLAGMRSEDGFRRWVDLVGHYTTCALTRDEDRLPAIGGLARMFDLAVAAGKGLGKYRAGLWEGVLLPCLLWRVEDAERARRPRAYVAPSWSWASLVGRVNWKCCREYRLRFVAQVLDCNTSCSVTDVFGRVKGGMVRMRTRTWEMQLEYQPAGRFMALTSGESAYFDVNGECKRNTYRVYQSVRCVVVAEGTSAPGLGPSALLALIVRQTRLEAETPSYERIGLAALDPRRLEDSVEETVIIV